ncbi:MAG: major capsid protein, partial [Chloroflexota bacterium]
AGFITQQLLAAAFEVDRVLVPEAIQNTAAEGLPGAYSHIFGKHMLLAYSNPNPSPLTPSAGYTFTWTGYMGAQENGLRIKRFRIEPIASDRVEGEFSFAPKVVAADLGRFYSAAVA